IAHQAVGGRNTTCKGRAIRKLRYIVLHNDAKPGLDISQYAFTGRHSGSAHGVGNERDAIRPLYLANQFEQWRRKVHTISDDLHVHFIDDERTFDNTGKTKSVASRHTRHA